MEQLRGLQVPKPTDITRCRSSRSPRSFFAYRSIAIHVIRRSGDPGMGFPRELREQCPGTEGHTIDIYSSDTVQTVTIVAIRS
jgi:hypothetical protein